MQSRCWNLLVVGLLVVASCDDDDGEAGATDSQTEGAGESSDPSESSDDDGDSSDASGSQGGSGSSDSAGQTTSGADPSDDPLQACVDRINMFRATEGLPPYGRWTDGEGCGEEQAAADAQSGQAHANFGDCSEFAQNTCPGWPSVEGILEGCFQQMWDEGPGEDYSEHGHYLAMSSTQYTEVACSFVETPDGSVWANQNFR